jgi:hypothetical protein
MTDTETDGHFSFLARKLRAIASAVAESDLDCEQVGCDRRANTRLR